MSKFSIISATTGLAIYSGCPSYTGTYMKPGMLEFREVSSPTPIDWGVGDYVVYTRTGTTYRLYSSPQLKKQARSTEYGAAFVYQGVQLFDDSKQLELCPFRDLVTGDNRIHFSTQPSISTFEAVDGIARRLEACLVDMYGANSWAVRVATLAEGVSQDLHDLMAEARDFTVSGVSILGALDKVYEVWPDVGWVYRVENGKNTIVIGGAGLSSTASYAYGKGNGLKSITRNPANAEELANRIFAYGSSRNMLPRWYNNQTIKDADSVDIQNLMLPINAIQSKDWPGWGLTGGLPDAAKAYVENAASILAIGLRPKTVYFDGTNDLQDIYPTLEGVTIKEVRDHKGPDFGDTDYIPVQSWGDSERVDQILAVNSTFDSGLAGPSGEATMLLPVYGNISISRSESWTPLNAPYTLTLFGNSLTIPDTGKANLAVDLICAGTINATGLSRAWVNVYVRSGSPSEMIASGTVELEKTGTGTFSIPNFSVPIDGLAFTAGQSIEVGIILLADIARNSTPVTVTTNMTGKVSVSAMKAREKTFNITLRQIGFDISAQAALGEGKVIAMKSGMCAGRSFTIKNCMYDQASDTWSLEVVRSQDDSLSQWFPNSTYPIMPDDEFVLLDIAMPQLYILIAEERLLDAAQALLAETAVQQWQYVPDIDAKFMVESARVIRPADFMVMTDSEVVGGTASVLVDTVAINEGEAAIPTYKVTLRDRKRKTYNSSGSVQQSTSNPVTNITSKTSTTPTTTPSATLPSNIVLFGDVVTAGAVDIVQLIKSNEDQIYPQTSIPAVVGLSDSLSGLRADIDTLLSWFGEDSNGDIYVKRNNGVARNFYSFGAVSAGGVASGGGGGGGATLLSQLEDVSLSSLASGDLLAWGGTIWENIPQSSITPDLTGYALLTDLPTSLSELSGDSTHRLVTDTQINTWNNKGTVTSVALRVPTGLSVTGTPVTTSGTFIVTYADGYAIPLTADVAKGVSAYDALGDYALKTGESTYNFLVNTLKFSSATLGVATVSSLPRPSWKYTDNVSSITPTTVTKYLAYKDEIPSSLKNPYKLTFNDGSANTAQYDGSVAITVTAASLGALTEHQEVTLDGGTANGTLKLTTAAGTSADVAVTGLGSLAYKSSLVAGDIPDISGTYVTKTTAQTVSGLKTFSNGLLSGDITPTTDSAKSLGTSSKRWNYIYGVTAIFSGEVTAAGGLYPGEDSTGNIGHGTNRWNNLNVRNIACTSFYLKDADWNNLAHFGGDSESFQLYLADSSELYYFGDGSFQARGTTKNLGTSSVRWGTLYATNADLSGDIYLQNAKAIYGKDTGGTDRRLLTLSSDNGLYIGYSALSRVQITATGQIVMYWGSFASGQYLIGGTGAYLYAPNFLPNGNDRTVGASSSRWAGIYSVDANLTGNLSLSSASYIDLGPIRLKYENNALHVTSNDGSTIGLYADGFVAAGGIQ